LAALFAVGDLVDRHAVGLGRGNLAAEETVELADGFTGLIHVRVGLVHSALLSRSAGELRATVVPRQKR
jgi:hypothetical protein